jgi:hypothetical protein
MKKKIQGKKNLVQGKESLIHVRVEYNEAVNSKKDFLSSEINLLRTASAIKRYSLLRLEELKIKNRLSGKVRELNSGITKLSQVLPKIKISVEEKKEKDEDKEFEIPRKYLGDDLEFELQEIQKRLLELEGNN